MHCDSSKIIASQQQCKMCQETRNPPPPSRRRKSRFFLATTFLIINVFSTGFAFVLGAVDTSRGARGATQQQGHQPGTTYLYRYETQSVLNSKRQQQQQQQQVLDVEGSGRDLKSSAKSNVRCDVVWQDGQEEENKLMRMSVSDVEVFDRLGKSVPTDISNADHLYLHLLQGKIQAVYTSKLEKTTAAFNFHRGIASLFQYQSAATDEIHETDVSGECSVSYTPDHHGVHKRKRNCGTEWRGRGSSILDLTSRHAHDSKYKIQQDSGVVESVRTEEVFTAEVTLKSEAGYFVRVTQTMELVGKKL